VLIYSEPMPASRLVGFALVWLALMVFTADALRGRARIPRNAVMAPARG
jgi:chloramphenicol-sensitive protein RarD